jgi:hypothetical protein
MIVIDIIAALVAIDFVSAGAHEWEDSLQRELVKLQHGQMSILVSMRKENGRVGNDRGPHGPQGVSDLL